MNYVKRKSDKILTRPVMHIAILFMFFPYSFKVESDKFLYCFINFNYFPNALVNVQENLLTINA